MASSDLLYPLFWIPLSLSGLHTSYSFLIGGKLGQVLCKLVHFFGNVFIVVSIQNLILIAVDRFWVVVFPLRSPLIRSKLCPFFILVTWIFAIVFNFSDVFTLELVEYPEGTWCVSRPTHFLREKPWGRGCVTVFLLCWLPFRTNHLIIAYQDSSAHFSCSFSIYFYVTYFLIHAYCAINPIICFMFSSNYRQGIKRLIKCSFVRA